MSQRAQGEAVVQDVKAHDWKSTMQGEGTTELAKSQPRHRVARTMECPGVVIVHRDGTFSCPLEQCPLEGCGDPFVVVPYHNVFVPCDADWRDCSCFGRSVTSESVAETVSAGMSSPS